MKNKPLKGKSETVHNFEEEALKIFSLLFFFLHPYAEAKRRCTTEQSLLVRLPSSGEERYYWMFHLVFPVWKFTA